MFKGLSRLILSPPVYSALQRRSRQILVFMPKIKSLAMYAVLKTGGKQYKVSQNDVIIVERLSGSLEQRST